VEGGDRQELLQIVERWSKKHLDSALSRPWFAVDARGALKHSLGEGAPPDDDFRLLWSHLAGLTGREREGLQKRGRYGQLLAEISLAREENEQVLRRIRENAERVTRDRAEARRQLQDLAQRFDATAKVERERLVLFAETKLSLGLQRLEAFLRTSGKESLRQKAGSRFEEQLRDTVRAIEKETDGALAKLAGFGCNPPAGLTIWERLSLDAQIEVGELPVIEASGGQKALGAIIGAGLRTLLLPGFGTGAGLALGRWIARMLWKTEPNYGTAFCDAARKHWEPAGRRVLDLLQAQYDARVARVKTRVEQADEADNQSTKSLAMETGQREALSAALDQCRHQLETGLSTPN
jgi:hypothetical protein